MLFVRNLASTVTEEILEKAFSQFGKLERVKKLKDYAFIHFEERDGAVKVRREKKNPHRQTLILNLGFINECCLDQFHRLWLISMEKTLRESTLKSSLPSPLTRRGKSVKPRDKPLKHKCK